MREVARMPLIEPHWSLRRELIRSTSWGGFAATTLWGCPTRKYHSWLSLWRDFRRYELLPQMQEELHLREGTFLLTTQYFHQKLVWEGYRHLQSFRAGAVWKWVYRIGDLSVEKSVYLSPTEPLWIFRYRFSAEVLFRWIPLWAARLWHELQTEKAQVERQGHTIYFPQDIVLNFESRPSPRFIPWPYVYEGVYYPEEAQRGYEATERLTATECWEWRLHGPGEVVIALSPAGRPSLSYELPGERLFHQTLSQTLFTAADEFFLRDASGEYVIAGHPWFGVWGRDTFISLPGLTLARGEEERFYRITDTALRYLTSEGKFPNAFPSDYSAEDTGLWWIWSIIQAHKLGLSAEVLWKRYGEAILQVLVGYLQRLARNDGLLYTEKFPPPSWMDAVVDQKPVVERRGALIELNALWYAALRFVADAASQEGVRWRWGLLARKVLESFKPTFWEKSQGYLADWREGSEVSWQIRPNQIFAASLPYRPISEKIAELIVDTIEKHLLTPRGLRTLSPADPAYRGRYEGTSVERDLAYHNGTAWLWLLGSYADAKYALWGDAAKPSLIRLFNGLEEALYAYGWGTLSEIYTGDAPHVPCGSPAQAWSVAEILRLAFILKVL
ncbi:MAG: amylo-alpha-1,6-glucosidase [Bacteroidia bacterium]|nr:amylo-alpha-1,6-glucosidase [Bacteroidia bacterium]MCX7652045.1 amylo-alpha-1,6-glucosidase [Bacteroidia bacterium]MDW8416284.1 amylo-alpha-1,6-glucosidase [Bacteroidia bacterium]